MQKKQQALLGILLVILIGLTAGWYWLSTQSANSTTHHTQQRVIVTTNAQAQIFNQLAIPLVGVPTPGDNQTLPKRYAKLPQVGNHVAPNLERIASLKPDMVYLDQALVSDYEQKLKSADVQTTALNFSDLTALRESIKTIGNSFNRQQQARQLNATLNLKAVHPNHRPKVALLMGMPGGSFLTGTKHSYVGDLINRAGGTVIGAGNGAYTTMNVEQIAAAQPDVIITMAHAMPKQVFQSFDELFTQPAWQALPAIKQHQVYQASEPTFGMTANLNAPAAFKQLKTWLQTN